MAVLSHYIADVCFQFVRGLDVRFRNMNEYWMREFLRQVDALCSPRACGFVPLCSL